MRAIIVRQSGSGVELSWEDAADPLPGPSEVLIRNRATAVNRADLLQARGLYPPPVGESTILGLEACGDVVALGSEVTNTSLGERVAALLPGGGYAEFVAIPEQLLLRIPASWSYEQGAAVPEVWLTAFLNLFLEGNLSQGKTLLIHAGASGVGTAATQLAKSEGITVFATVGTNEKAERLLALGADFVINYNEQDFAAKVRAATNQEGVDFVLDCVGGPYMERNLEVLRPLGQLASIGLMGGKEATIDMSLILGKRLTIRGSTLRNRPLEEKIKITEAFRDRFWPKFLTDELKPVVDCAFPITEAGRAHEYVRQNKNFGKVILRF